MQEHDRLGSAASYEAFLLEAFPSIPPLNAHAMALQLAAAKPSGTLRPPRWPSSLRCLGKGLIQLPFSSDCACGMGWGVLCMHISAYRLSN